MKKLILEFWRRGTVACGIGPIVLAILYLIMQHQTGLETLTVNQVCLGILSLSALAFVAGGMNFIYQIERLPLMVAILIHGIVLYSSYLITYLINGWLGLGITPFLVFTGIFLFGYLVIWVIIYSISRRNTTKLNAVLEKKRQPAE
ncbi:MAG: DUF3021 domain-containing protein [Oscillospiraceae bacterium]|nr:DUF3021 domain-containing protein [Oscillospiraceae bacterium]